MLDEQVRDNVNLVCIFVKSVSLLFPARSLPKPGSTTPVAVSHSPHPHYPGVTHHIFAPLIGTCAPLIGILETGYISKTESVIQTVTQKCNIFITI